MLVTANFMTDFKADRVSKNVKFINFKSLSTFYFCRKMPKISDILSQKLNF